MKKLALLLTPFVLVGCGGDIAAPIPGDQEFAPVARVVAEPPVIPNGSLFQAGRARDLFQDARARNVGDILTVTLQEATQASKAATSGSSKQSDVNITPFTIGGESPSLLGRPLSFSTGDNTRSFTGSGSANQSNSLTGNITVMVTERLPGGVLRIAGEKWLELNQGKEYIRLTGLIRPDDINPDNTIVSTRIADARIAYSGSGPIGNANRPGWLARFFMSPVWPF